MVRVFTHPRCLQHQPPDGYPETPERLRVILEGLEASGWEIVERLAEPSVARAAVTRVHDPLYLARFKRTVESGARLLDTGDNPLVPDTWDAAWAAVQVSLAAADWMMEGEGRKPFAAVRPPGHHAERAMAMGFCYFNNVAIVAEHLRAEHGLKRVAIFDFDVHHGNGTQHLFEEREEILYVSTHQSPLYPGTGAASERGVGSGQGSTLNLPLAPGGGNSTYLNLIEEQVAPALRAFAPQAILISAGFDAWRLDPVGGMSVTADGYEAWGASIAGIAEELCAGRVLSLLEGGYDIGALPGLADSYLRGLQRA